MNKVILNGVDLKIEDVVNGGKSEAVSRKRRNWRAQRGAGIALPRR